MSSSNQNTPTYRRGPYNRISKSKNGNSKATSVEDTKKMINKLRTFKKEITEEFKVSSNRSKIVDNLQGIIDCFVKQVKRIDNDESSSLEQTLQSINEKLENISDRLQVVENNSCMSLDSFLQ